jgi:hypothetical protein
MGFEVEQEVRKSEQNEADGGGEGHLAEAGGRKREGWGGTDAFRNEDRGRR